MTDNMVREGTQYQRAGESIVYTLTTTPWGSAPTSVAVTVMDLGTDADVSSTVLLGSPTVVGDIITLPNIHALTAKRRYQVDIRFTAGLSTYVAYFVIQATR